MFEHGGDHFLTGNASTSDFLKAGENGIARSIGELYIDLEFRFEIKIEGAFAELGFLRDLVHRCPLEARSQKDPLCRLENLFSPALFFSFSSATYAHFCADIQLMTDSSLNDLESIHKFAIDRARFANLMQRGAEIVAAGT